MTCHAFVTTAHVEINGLSIVHGPVNRRALAGVNRRAVRPKVDVRRWNAIDVDRQRLQDGRTVIKNYPECIGSGNGRTDVARFLPVNTLVTSAVVKVNTLHVEYIPMDRRALARIDRRTIGIEIHTRRRGWGNRGWGDRCRGNRCISGNRDGIRYRRP
jgi:hypothetical protein